MNDIDDTPFDYPTEYWIATNPVIGLIFGGLFVCWWLFLIYMMFISDSNGGEFFLCIFFVFTTLMVTRALLVVMRCKFHVKGNTITQYFVLSKPKTYDLTAITKVVIHNSRGASYRIYVEKKKIFTLNDSMDNLFLFMDTLRAFDVPFKQSLL